MRPDDWLWLMPVLTAVLIVGVLMGLSEGAHP